ncbi:MAG: Crp/Fnr family transcriptional regulator [Acidobacteriia bacterium]|nr:Crp/Fnr family transcriptional regulator [Terriglobia bacterium]
MVDGNSVVKRLEAVGEAVTHGHEAVLFDQGQPSVGAYVLKSGNTRLSLLDYEGTPIWSRTVEPGAILGLPSTLGHTPYSLRATTVGQVELVFVAKPKLEELMRQDTVFCTALLKVVSEELVDFRRKLSLLRPQIPQRPQS